MHENVWGVSKFKWFRVRIADRHQSRVVVVQTPPNNNNPLLPRVGVQPPPQQLQPPPGCGCSPSPPNNNPGGYPRNPIGTTPSGTPCTAKSYAFNLSQMLCLENNYTHMVLKVLRRHVQGNPKKTTSPPHPPRSSVPYFNRFRALRHPKCQN